MVLIKVTQYHIIKGHQKSCHFCPVALAIADVMKNTAMGRKDVTVYTTSYFVGDYTAPLPAFVSNFIHNYDFNDIMGEPFEFELNIPAEYLK